MVEIATLVVSYLDPKTNILVLVTKNCVKLLCLAGKLNYCEPEVSSSF